MMHKITLQYTLEDVTETASVEFDAIEHVVDHINDFLTHCCGKKPNGMKPLS